MKKAFIFVILIVLCCSFISTGCDNKNYIEINDSNVEQYLTIKGKAVRSGISVPAYNNTTSAYRQIKGTIEISPANTNLVFENVIVSIKLNVLCSLVSIWYGETTSISIVKQVPIDYTIKLDLGGHATSSNTINLSDFYTAKEGENPWLYNVNILNYSFQSITGKIYLA